MSSEANNAGEVRSIREALRLARLFVAGDIDAPAFQSEFLHARLLPDEGPGSDRGEQFLDEVFWDVDDFVEDEPRENSDDIDADELRRRVAAQLAAYDRSNAADE